MSYLIIKKHPLTTNLSHQTNTMVPFVCKMNLLFTICILEKDFVKFGTEVITVTKIRN